MTEEFTVPLSSSEDSLDLTQQETTAEEPVKLKVPSSPAMEKENIENHLQRYLPILDELQVILLWRRPLVLGCIVILQQLFFLIAYLLDLGAIGVLLLSTVYAKICKLLAEHSSILVPVHPDNLLFSLDDFCEILSVVGSRLQTFWESVKTRANDDSFIGQLLWLGILVCLTGAAALTSVFWLCYIITTTALVLPGIVFHPEIRPHVQFYLDWLLNLIAPKVKDDDPHFSDDDVPS